MQQPGSGTFIATVKEFFPEATDEEAMGILWNYTDYPNMFSVGRHLRDQLDHLARVGFEQVDRELDEQLAQ